MRTPSGEPYALACCASGKVSEMGGKTYKEGRQGLKGEEKEGRMEGKRERTKK